MEVLVESLGERDVDLGLLAGVAKGIAILAADDFALDVYRVEEEWCVQGQLGMRRLAPEIHQAAEESQEEVLEVARSAEARLAA